MKRWMIIIAASIMAACGAASDVSEPAPALDLQALLPVFEGEGVWTVVPEQSSLTFDAAGPNDAYKVVPFTGEFENFAAAIKLDLNDLSDAKIVALIDTGSANLNDGDRQKNWPSSVWADIANFPVAKFESRSFSRMSDGMLLASGTLTIKGISKPVDLPFNLRMEEHKSEAVGTVVLDRRDFKLGDSFDFADEGWVKFPVTVNVNIIATR